MGLFMWSPGNPAPTFGTGKDKKLGMEWERANIARKGQVQASGLSAAASVAGKKIEGRNALGMRGLTSGRDAAGAAHMSAMEQMSLSGQQAMDIEGLRQSGQTQRARIGQSTTGGGMSNRRMVDVPMYNESGSMVIGTTPGIVDMETGEYTELSKKKKKKKPLSDMTVEELLEARKAFGR